MDKTYKCEEDSKLSTAMLVGGGLGVLALSAVDGGILTFTALAVTGYGTNKVVASALRKDGEKAEEVMSLGKTLAAAACGLAAFLNPLIGIPGAIAVIIGWYLSKGEMSELVRKVKALVSKAKEKTDTATTIDVEGCAV